MEQSLSWKAERFSDSQETSRILWNLKVHYRIYKSPPPGPGHCIGLLSVKVKFTQQHAMKAQRWVEV